MNNLTADDKLRLIQEVGEEIIGLEEIKNKITNGNQLIAYDGFEPSGRIPISHGFLRVLNIQKLLQAGIHFKVLIADWHAFANNKMNGDLEKIKTIGKYFIEVWKACGLDTSQVEFIWASDLVKEPNYWLTVLKVARAVTLKRIIRCSQIMGRRESDDLSAAQIIYPAMQATDIFYLGVDIAQLGLDQRKVNMLAREIATELGYQKPAVVHHHLLMGLQPPTNNSSVEDKIEKTIALKMSKSLPSSAIFMTDTAEEVQTKINSAYCPPQDITINPVLEYFKYLIFAKYPEILLKREAKYGGDLRFSSYSDLEKTYAAGQIYPLDLKNNLIRYLNEILEPIRQYFIANPEAKKLKEEIESFEITR